MRRFDPELDRLAYRLGHGEGAEQPVEQRQDIAKIAVMMFGRDRMMELVVRGAEDPTTPARAKGDPQMRMLEMADQNRADHRQSIGAKQGCGRGSGTEEIAHQTAGRPHDERDKVVKSD